MMNMTTLPAQTAGGLAFPQNPATAMMPGGVYFPQAAGTGDFMLPVFNTPQVSPLPSSLLLPVAQAPVTNNIENTLVLNLLLQQQAQPQVQQQAPSSGMDMNSMMMMLLIKLLKERRPESAPPAEAPPPPPPSKPAPAPAPKAETPAPKTEEKPVKKAGSGLMDMAKKYFMANSDYAGLMPVVDALTGGDEDAEDKSPIQNLLSTAFMAHVGDAAVRGAKTPLVFDLDGDGVNTSTSKTQFDIDGDGTQEEISDIAKGDGLLVIDADKNGVAGENGKEVLGDNTDLDGDGQADGFKDGFDALKGLAEKARAEGLIDGDNTLDSAEIARLEKAYGLSMKVGSLNNAAGSLADAGLKSIDLATGKKTFFSDFDGQGNSTLKQDGASFTRADGSTGGYEDIHFKTP